MSDSINLTFKDLALSEEKDNANEVSQLSNVFEDQRFLTQRSLTLQSEETAEIITPIEEQKLDISHSKLQKNWKKRKLDSNTKEELKMMKMVVEGQHQQNPITVTFRPQKKYQVNTKVKAIELCKKVRTLRVATSTGIPESSLRCWRKGGSGRVDKSGRLPKYEEIEPDLFSFFKDCRAAGVAVNN